MIDDQERSGPDERQDASRSDCAEVRFQVGDEELLFLDPFLRADLGNSRVILVCCRCSLRGRKY